MSYSLGTRFILAVGVWVSVTDGPAHAQVANAVPRYELSMQIRPEARELTVEGRMTIDGSAFAGDTVLLQLTNLMNDVTLATTDSIAVRAVPIPQADSSVRVWRLTRRAGSQAADVSLRFSYGSHAEVAFEYGASPEIFFAYGAGIPWYPQLVGSNGKGIGTLTFQTPPDFVVASSGRRQDGTQDTRRSMFAVTRPSAFAFAAARYHVTHAAGPIPVTVYLLRPRTTVREYTEGCATVLQVLSRLFGPYPFDHYDLVEIPDDIAGNAGFSGASTPNGMWQSSHVFEGPFNRANFAHELSHQWWGVAITRSGSAGAGMMDEAMAEYGSIVAVEEIEGQSAASQFRREGYPGYGEGGVGYFQLAAAGFDPKLTSLTAAWTSYQQASRKGARAWYALDHEIGRSNISKAFRRITEQHEFERVAWTDFLSALRLEGGTAVDRWVAEWLDRPGAPDWDLRWSQVGDTVRGTVAQKGELYTATVDVLFEGDAPSHGRRRRVRLAGRETPFAMAAPFRTRSVVVDPDYQVLHWTTDIRTLTNAQAHGWRAFGHVMNGEYAAADEELSPMGAGVPTPDGFGVGFILDEAAGRLALRRQDRSTALRHFIRAVSEPVRPVRRLALTYFQIANVAKALGQLDTVRWAVDAALTIDATSGEFTGWGSTARTLLPVARPP